MDLPVHILSIAGIVDNNILKMRQIFSWFLASRYSQTYLYSGKIASLKYILSKYDQVDYRIEDEIKSALIKLYKNYFTDVDVNVLLEATDGSLIKTMIEITIIDERGNKVELKDSITVKDMGSLIDNEEMESYYKFLKR